MRRLFGYIAAYTVAVDNIDDDDIPAAPASATGDAIVIDDDDLLYPLFHL